MPLFDFKCPVCDAVRVDVLQSASDPAPSCLECCDAGQQYFPVRMVRQPSAPAFRVNGFNAKGGYTTKDHGGDLKGIRTKVSG